MENNIDVSYPIISLLEQAKTTVEAIVEDFRDFFFVIDESGKVLKSNSVGTSLFQSSTEEVINKSLSELFSPESWDKFIINVRRLISLSQ